MNAKKHVKTGLFALVVFLTLSVILSGQIATAATQTVSESFDDSSDWSIATYDALWNQEVESFGFTLNNTTQAEIKDSKLVFQDLNTSDHRIKKVSIASMNSSVVYGEWSFDIYSAGSELDVYIAFTYDNENITYDGLIENYLNWSGYGLGIATHDVFRGYGPGFRVIQYEFGGAKTLRSYKTPNDQLTQFQEAWNNIHIVRHLDGQITVLLNGYKLFTTGDGAIPFNGTASRLEFANFNGNTEIDNLQIIEYDDPNDEFVYNSMDESQTVKSNWNFVIIGSIFGGILTTYITYHGKKN